MTEKTKKICPRCTGNGYIRIPNEAVGIPKDTTIGMTHIEVGNDLIRTPLGGFINHSEEPNCERKQHNNRWFLKTIQDIDRNRELTLRYSMYKP